MAGLRADALGVSVGQPGRIDQQSEAYQDRLRAGARLEIPQSTIDRTRPEVRDDAGRRSATGFQAQDRAAAESGAAWADRRTSRWDSFAEGRGRRTPSRGQVVIDGQSTGVHAAREVTSETPALGATEPRDGWTAMRRMHQRAARFEEYAQERVQPFLGQGAPKAPRVRRGVVVDD